MLGNGIFPSLNTFKIEQMERFQMIESNLLSLFLLIHLFFQAEVSKIIINLTHIGLYTGYKNIPKVDSIVLFISSVHHL